MAVFEYHDTLDETKMALLPPRSQQIIRAAFTVAERAHAGQVRHKLITDTYPEDQPYITHPLMVFDMIWRTEGYDSKIHKAQTGENKWRRYRGRPDDAKLMPEDTDLLAAALLHDALEDYPAYRANESLMLDDLKAELKAQGLDPATDDRALRSANHIFMLCEQMTNPDKSTTKPYAFPVDKRMYQADRVVHKLTNSDARILKMADQMASMICQLTRADDPKKFSKEKARKAGNKGNDLIRAVLDTPIHRDPRDLMPPSDAYYQSVLEPWRGLYEQVLGYYRRIMAPGADEDKIREAFARDPLPVTRISKAKWNADHPQLQRVGEPIAIKKSRSGHGVSAISLNKDGDVIGYVCWESPDNEFSHRNRLEVALRDAIEHDHRDTEVYSRGFTAVMFKPREDDHPPEKDPATQFGQPFADETFRGRIFRLSKPLKLDVFLDIAGRSLTKDKEGVPIQPISPQERTEVEARVQAMRRVNQLSAERAR